MGVEVKLHAFLTLAVDRGEWPASKFRYSCDSRLDVMAKTDPYGLDHISTPGRSR
jgi:hypothetical protein